MLDIEEFLLFPSQWPFYNHQLDYTNISACLYAFDASSTNDLLPCVGGIQCDKYHNVTRIAIDIKKKWGHKPRYA